MEEKKLHELKIIETLRSFFPPLSEDEYKLLEENLLENGCTDPLIVWDGAIVDGHNRYFICHKHNIPFNILEMEFKDLNNAMLWMAKRQLGRRNLKPFQRCELVYPLEQTVKEEANLNHRKNISIARKNGEKMPNLASSQTTRDLLASMAAVSHGTWDKAKAVIEMADEGVKEKLRDGTISINGAYRQVKPKAEKTAVEKTADPEENTPDDEQPIPQESVPKINNRAKSMEKVDWKNDPRRPTIAQPIEVRPIQNTGPATNQQVQDRFASAVETFVDTTEIALKWITEENATEINWDALLRKVKKGMNPLFLPTL